MTIENICECECGNGLLCLLQPNVWHGPTATKVIDYVCHKRNCNESSHKILVVKSIFHIRCQ